MWRFIARRLMWAVFLFVAVTFITYVIFFVAPNDPAKLAAGKAATPAVAHTWTVTVTVPVLQTRQYRYRSFTFSEAVALAETMRTHWVESTVTLTQNEPGEQDEYATT